MEFPKRCSQAGLHSAEVLVHPSLPAAQVWEAGRVPGPIPTLINNLICLLLGHTNMLLPMYAIMWEILNWNICTIGFGGNWQCDLVLKKKNQGFRVR